MPTPATRLAGIPGIDFHNLDTLHGRLVGQKVVKLGERPAMEAPLQVNRFVVLPSSNRRGGTNVFQVLKNQGRSLWSGLYDAFGEDVIMVFSLPKPFARKLFQVPFGRFCSLLLEPPTEAKEAAFLFLPAFVTKKVTLRGHSRTSEPQVNSDHRLMGKYAWFGDVCSAFAVRKLILTPEVSGMV